MYLTIQLSSTFTWNSLGEFPIIFSEISFPWNLPQSSSWCFSLTIVKIFKPVRQKMLQEVNWKCVRILPRSITNASIHRSEILQEYCPNVSPKILLNNRIKTKNRFTSSNVLQLSKVSFQIRLLRICRE